MTWHVHSAGQTRRSLNCEFNLSWVNEKGRFDDDRRRRNGIARLAILIPVSFALLCRPDPSNVHPHSTTARIQGENIMHELNARVAQLTGDMQEP